MISDPILWIGIDIGLKRDTSALVATYQDHDTDTFDMWGFRIWTPPVNMIVQVEPVLRRLLQQQRIGGVFYDPTQFETTRQRMAEEGFGHLFIEVNQMTEMTHACSTLQALSEERRFLPIKDDDLRSQYVRTAVQMTERGPRLIKSKQSVLVDATVASAMSPKGATVSDSTVAHPSYHPATHARSATCLP